MSGPEYVFLKGHIFASVAGTLTAAFLCVAKSFLLGQFSSFSVYQLLILAAEAISFSIALSALFGVLMLPGSYLMFKVLMYLKRYDIASFIIAGIISLALTLTAMAVVAIAVDMTLSSSVEDGSPFANVEDGDLLLQILCGLAMSGGAGGIAFRRYGKKTFVLNPESILWT